MSPLLEQQELLEVPPSRRLIVPVGCASHWGVDSSTLRVAVAYTAAGGLRGVEMESFPTLDGVGRLSAVYDACRGLPARLIRGHGFPAPGIVMVEQPSGSKQSVNLPLIYAVGVIQAGLYDGLRDVLGRPVRFESCTASWWRKRAVGYGSISKPTRKALGRAPVFEDYRVAVWARANGYEGSSWDCADALGIAEAARREVALEQR